MAFRVGILTNQLTLEFLSKSISPGPPTLLAPLKKKARQSQKNIQLIKGIAPVNMRNK